MTADPKPELLPGDCLLYWRADLVDWIIRCKTWTKCAHVEVYRGEGMSYASRNGIGVNIYPVRWDGLVAIRRPDLRFGTVNTGAAASWFSGVQGQGYDWIGLCSFYIASVQGSPKKMFCSEFATRLYRAYGFAAIACDYDADLVAPAQFEQTPALKTVWLAGQIE